jgi:Fe-S-cluster containining protein
MNSTPHNPDHSDISSCRRCGACCKKGGPTFHQTDKPLIENGIIQIRYLYTLRKGELVRDPIRGSILPTNAELIKIRSKDGKGICTFYDGNYGHCQIYAHRPLECQLLKCWDTSALEAMYEKDRLSRRDLLADMAGLWELLVDHGQRCDYSRMQDLISNLKKEYKKQLAGELCEMISYDNHLRQLVIEKGQMKPEMLDFLLGRPMEETLEGYGLRLRRLEGKIVLSASVLA